LLLSEIKDVLVFDYNEESGEKLKLTIGFDH